MTILETEPDDKGEGLRELQRVWRQSSEYEGRIEAAANALGTPDEISSIVNDPNHWRVQNVLLHCYSAGSYTCDVSGMIAASDRKGQIAILAILTMYALHGEDGWIFELGTRLSSARA